ncbi:MAG: lamin tail domain-containing protein [Candidatus Eisenbacteria bacterium]
MSRRWPHRALRTLVLACSTLLVPVSAGAGIVVDGVTSDWFGQLPPSDNTARVARRHDQSGELVWRDAAGDARGSAAMRACDLRQFRVTGDADRLYLLATFTGPVPASGDSAWQLQVTVDINRFSGLGAGAFLGTDAPFVTPDAAWEYAVQTRFGSGQPPRLVDQYGNELAGAVAALNPAGACEISIPWAAMGFLYPPADPIRLCVASFLSDASDEILPAGDGVPARAADVVSQYGLAGSGNTRSELTDAQLDQALDAFFDGRGRCIAPLVVNEVFFEGGVNAQWLELVNVSSSVLPLNQFKVGDAETPGANEGMARFPEGLLLDPGHAVVVAARGATFFAEHGFRADAECNSSDGATPDMLAFTGWASNIAFNVPAAGDQVLVLDRANTVVDVITYKNATYPGVTAKPAVPSLHSLERSSPNLDTDDCAVDLADRATPTPATVSQFAGVDGGAVSATRWTGAWPVPSAGAVRLALELAPDAAGASVEIVDVGGRRVRTLPLAGRGTGAFVLEWDGHDGGGRLASPGVYFARLHGAAGTAPAVRRIVIAR